ncbi:MAG TPA: serine/threonine protein phosphatase [Cyanobacteria bacterium UBA11372]|nr:serine/threonine protein phosphatase [Cyanobacteria bacterium UBA11372]
MKVNPFLRKLFPSSCRDWKFWLKTALVAIAYYTTAKLALAFITLPGDVVPIWPPAGTSLAATLIWGYPMWIGVFVGCYLGQLSSYGFVTTLWVTVSETFISIFAAYLIRRLIGNRYILDRVKDVVIFIIVGAFFGCIPSGIMSPTILCLSGKIPWSLYHTVVLTWTLSEQFAVLIFTPLFLAWSQNSRQTVQLVKKRWMEAAVLCFLVIAVSRIAFGGGYPVEFMVIPLIVWAAFRFHQPGSTLLIVILSSIAIVGTVKGFGYFVRDSQNESLLLLDSFVGVIALTNLLLGAVLNENDRAKADLRHANATLESKVKERTSELATANEEIIALNEKLKSENLRMSAELEVARQIQSMILPKSEELNIEGLDIAGYMEPAEEVGGDYYDVLYTDGVVTMGIGDVTGHGLESGILMLMTQTAVRTLKEAQEYDPVKFLDTLNRTIYKNVQRMNSQKNLTLVILNYFEGRISISGQHEETLVVRKGGHIERIDTIDLGFPLGLDEDIAKLINHTTLELQPGDGVVLYTDGIPEAIDIHQNFYGLQRLCDVVSSHWHLDAEQIKQTAIEDLRRFIGKQKVFDDITLLVLKYKGSSIVSSSEMRSLVFDQ